MTNHYLGIETSSTNCSVGVFENNELIDSLELNDGYSHGEVLAGMVNDLLLRNNVLIKDINAIGVGQGPGSYTGLRIGVAFAKGLAFSNQIELIAIDSLRNMAMQAILNDSIEFSKEDVLLSLVDARRDEVYIQMFNSAGDSKSKTKALIIDNSCFSDLKRNNQVYCFGSGSDKLALLNNTAKDFIHLKNLFPSAKGMGSLLHNGFLSKKFEDLAYFEPYYLKEFIAGKPKKNLLIP